MSAHDSSPELTEQAIDWFVLLRSGEAGPEDYRRFAAWRARDPAHDRAYTAVARLYGDMGRVARAGLETPAAPGRTGTHRGTAGRRESLTPPPRRRRPLAARIALAAATAWLVALLLVLPDQYHLLDAFLSDHYTRTGEQREIRLADGSGLLLNTNTAVSVDYGQGLRRVRLHHGQARFTVADDPRRPFEVRVDGLVVRDLGTVFEVYRRESGEIEVTVEEHAVSVAADKQPETAVGAGQRIRYRPGAGLERPVAVDPRQASGWQRRRLWINDRPLAELLAEVDRYRVGRVFVTDGALARLPVTGVFSLEDPDAILGSVSKALALSSTRLGPWWLVLHR